MRFNQFIDTIKKQIKEDHFSGAIHITQNDETIFANAYGYANRADKIPNRIDTSFGIASGTKLFTALAVGKLIEDGKLTLDSRVFDIVKYSFNRKYYDERITVAQLLSHTSGIPDYYDEDIIDDFDNFELSVPNHKLKSPYDYLVTFPEREKKFAPGNGFSYCNGAYILLSAIVETLADIPFQKYVEERILEPMNMKHSGFFSFNALPTNTALGYITDGDIVRTNIYDLPIIGSGDGGMYTSVTDMVKLWHNLLNDKILSPSLTSTFLKPHASMNDEGKLFAGYGNFMYKLDNGYARYIVGCDAGVSFKSCYHEPHNVQYTVVSNTTDGAWSMIDLIDKALG